MSKKRYILILKFSEWNVQDLKLKAMFYFASMKNDLSQMFDKFIDFANIMDKNVEHETCSSTI